MADVKLAVTAANGKIGLDQAISLLCTTPGTLTTISASKVLVTNSSSKIESSTITTAQLGYLTDVTANIQGQVDAKADLAGATFTGKVLINSAFGLNTRKYDTTSVTLDANDTIALIDTATAGSTVTVNLPAISGGERIIVIKDKGSAGTINIIIEGNGAETIDGSANITLASNYESVTLFTDGTTGWYII